MTPEEIQAAAVKLSRDTVSAAIRVANGSESDIPDDQERWNEAKWIVRLAIPGLVAACGSGEELNERERRKV